MKVFAATVDDSYSLTIAVGASVWGVVGVFIPWVARLVLPFLFIIIIDMCVRARACVCVFAFIQALKIEVFSKIDKKIVQYISNFLFIY